MARKADPILDLGNEVAREALATMAANEFALQWTMDTFPAARHWNGFQDAACPPAYRAKLPNGATVWITRYTYRERVFALLLEDGFDREIVRVPTTEHGAIARLWDEVAAVAPRQIRERTESEILNELRRVRTPDKGLED